MTYHQAAAVILREAGRPLPAKEVARRALAKGLVRSNAGDPVESVAQTMRRTSGARRTTGPSWRSFGSPDGRLVGLPSHGEGPSAGAAPRAPQTPPMRDLIPADEVWPVALPARLVNKLDLCVMVGLGGSREAAAAEMLARGLAAAAEEIAEATRDHLRAGRAAGSAAERQAAAA